MKASDVMTLNVVSVTPDSSILHAARLMLQKNISGLPVITSAGGLVGIITEGDFLRRKETETQRHRSRWIEFLLGPGRLAEEYSRSSGRKVEEVMTSPVRTVTEDTSLEEIVHLMERHHIKRVPVMRGTRVVGMISRANLLRAVVRLSHEVEPISAGDKEIRDKLLAELKKQPWAPIALIDVAVKEGVVTLSGAVTDERERGALRITAENIAGVKKVVDELVWIEPMSGMVA
jgi:CBS domain-containing protein